MVATSLAVVRWDGPPDRSRFANNHLFSVVGLEVSLMIVGFADLLRGGNRLYIYGGGGGALAGWDVENDALSSHASVVSEVNAKG